MCSALCYQIPWVGVGAFVVHLYLPGEGNFQLPSDKSPPYPGRGGVGICIALFPGRVVSKLTLGRICIDRCIIATWNAFSEQCVAYGALVVSSVLER